MESSMTTSVCSAKSMVFYLILYFAKLQHKNSHKAYRGQSIY